MSDSANNDPIGSFLGVPAIPGDQPGNQVTKLMGELLDDSASADFTKARVTILDMIDKGQTSLNVLMEIARQSQQPRAFEVISNLINTMLSASDQLMKNQLAERKIKEASIPKNPEAKGPGTVNNNLILTTADLGKILTDAMKNALPQQAQEPSDGSKIIDGNVIK